MSDEKLPALKMIIEEGRRCQGCGETIARWLLTDGERTWIDSRNSGLCWDESLGEWGQHVPWEVVPTSDPNALAAWLDA